MGRCGPGSGRSSRRMPSSDASHSVRRAPLLGQMPKRAERGGHVMASVRRKGDGWQMIWFVREVDGARRQRTRQFPGASKKAALREARRLEEEAQTLAADAGEESVAGFLQDWL